MGTGVIGLTTALELKRDNPEYDITVIGQHLPGDIDPDYTSPFAGANWQSFASHEDKYLQELDRPGYTRFIDLAKNEPTSGVWEKKNISYVSNEDTRTQEEIEKELIPWFSSHVKEFHILEKEELLPETKYGTQFNGVVISVPIYLNYLVAENTRAGNIIHRVRKLANITEALDFHVSGKKADLVINATGLLANKLAGFKDEKKSYPVRGQVMLVKNNAKFQIGVEGFAGYKNEMLYMMPRKEGGTIIGGCFEVNSTDTKENPEFIRRTIERAIKFAPELIDPNYKQNPTEIEIVRINVGFRPFREGGARIEADKDHSWLVHNYGYGGGGYQGSYGGTEIIKRIVRDKTKRAKTHL